MELSGRRILVTGGAGFVGSHLAADLAADNDVVVADDLSNGRREWVPDGVAFSEVDLSEPAGVEAVVTGDLDLVVHAAADKDAARDDPAQFRSNTAITAGLLDRMDDVGVERIAFTSSSTVYGEAPRPTPEDHAPLEPISVYGAAKVAGEGLCSVYAHSHGVTARVVRFANVVGPRLRGAVIPDFVEKLREDPATLTILGDGRQEKSYLHVTDCVAAIRHVIERAAGPYAVYNVGTASTTSVDRVATIVAEEMGVDPERSYTGGDRGWTGDVPRMRLAVDRLADIGFEASLGSDAAVRRATRELLAEP